MRRCLLCLSALFLSLALAGCGNKGPLTLPRSQPAAAPAPAATVAPDLPPDDQS